MTQTQPGQAISGRRRLGGLLRHREFRLLWTGETISSAGNAMAAVAMPLLAVTALRASTFTVGGLLAASYVPWLILGLPAGAWLDRLPARRVMIICDVVSVTVYGSIPVAGWLGILTVGQLLAVALLAGSASVLFGTAYQVYLPSLVAPDDLVEGNAKLQGSAQAALLGGSGLAGLVMQAFGAAAGLLIDAVSFAVSAACLLGIGPRTSQPAPPRPDTELWRTVTDGLRFVARDPYLRRLGVFGMVANLALTGFQALVIVFLVRVIRLDSLAVGLLSAVLGIGGLSGALTARRLSRKLGTARSLLLATVGALPFGLLIPLAGAGLRLPFYIAGVLVTAWGIAVANIITAIFRQVYSPPGMLGRVTAIMRFMTIGITPAGALLGGALGSVIGVRGALWVIFAVVASSGMLLATPSFLARRDLPSVPLTSK